MELERFEFIKDNGIIVDGKRYGFNITKVEIDGGDINIYIGSMKFCENFDEFKKEPEWSDMNNPLELNKYKNVKIYEDKKVVVKDEVNS